MSAYLVGRRILDDQRLVVAHPDVVMPVPSADEEVTPTAKAVLASKTPIDVVWRLITGSGDERLIKPVAALRLSSLMMIRDAVLAGAGAALLPKLLVEDDIKSGRLAYWGTDTHPPVEIWALRNSRHLVSAKVRAFLDVIEQVFSWTEVRALRVSYTARREDPRVLACSAKRAHLSYATPLTIAAEDRDLRNSEGHG